MCKNITGTVLEMFRLLNTATKLKTDNVMGVHAVAYLIVLGMGYKITPRKNPKKLDVTNYCPQQRV